MSSSPLHSPTGPPGFDPVVAGTAYCIASALAYTGVSICLRQLAALEADPMWVTFNKELVTVIVVGLWLLFRALRGVFPLPPWRPLGALVVVGLAVQLGANLGMQWAFGVKGVGLAVAIPAVFGVMLSVSAVLGRIFLGERVSPRQAAAIGLLLVSLAVLTVGAGAAGESITAAAIGVVCLAGTIYAILVITIRHTVTGPTPISAVVFTITLMGALSLGPLSIYRLGTPHLLSTPREHLVWMLAAGALNLIGFLAITKGLELTTVVHANVLGATQVAMAAIAGILLFHEPGTLWLFVGVGLTTLGVLLIDRPDHGDRQRASTRTI